MPIADKCPDRDCGIAGRDGDDALIGKTRSPFKGSTVVDALLNIVHEDNRLMVINKPAGLVCHPTKGDIYSSLVSRVRIYLDGASAGSRFHLINRLDRETSGLVVVAKTDAAHQNENTDPGVGVVTAAVILRGRRVEIRPLATDGHPDQPDNDGREALKR